MDNDQMFRSIILSFCPECGFELLEGSPMTTRCPIGCGSLHYLSLNAKDYSNFIKDIRSMGLAKFVEKNKEYFYGN